MLQFCFFFLVRIHPYGNQRYRVSPDEICDCCRISDIVNILELGRNVYLTVQTCSQFIIHTLHIEVRPDAFERIISQWIFLSVKRWYNHISSWKCFRILYTTLCIVLVIKTVLNILQSHAYNVGHIAQCTYLIKKFHWI